MAHAQKPNFVFRRIGRVHLNRRGRQFSRLLAAEVCASAVVMLDTPCSEVVRRVLATQSISLFSLHFPSRASPCDIRFQFHSLTDAPISCSFCFKVSSTVLPIQCIFVIQGVALATETGISLIINNNKMVATFSTCYYVVTFLTKWGNSASNFVAISS